MSGADPKADFDRYLSSEDAQQAEWWQLVTLSALRNAIGRPLVDGEYARLRAELATKFGGRS